MKRLTTLLLLYVAIIFITLFACKNTEEGDNVSDANGQIPEIYENVAIKIGNYEVTLRELQFRYGLQKNNMLASYGSLIYDMELDISKPFYEQQYAADTEITWSRYVLNNAVTELLQTVYFYNEAISLGYYEKIYSQTEDYLTQYMQKITENASIYEMETEFYIKELYGEGMDSSWLREYVRRSYIAASYYSEIIQNFEISDEEYGEYYAKNEAQCIENDYKTVAIRHILIIPNQSSKFYFEDGKTLDEESTKKEAEKADSAAREKAEAIMDEWLSKGGTAELFSSYAEKYSQDSETASNGGYSCEFQKGYYEPAFDDWCFDDNRQPGDYEIIKTEIGYQIIYFEAYCRPFWQILADSEMSEQHYYDLISELEKKYPVERNEELIDITEKSN